jgi:hypothetical protein
METFTIIANTTGDPQAALLDAMREIMQVKVRAALAEGCSPVRAALDGNDALNAAIERFRHVAFNDAWNECGRILEAQEAQGDDA